jgi:multiple sugar transport system substrate-binding protein
LPARTTDYATAGFRSAAIHPCHRSSCAAQGGTAEGLGDDVCGFGIEGKEIETEASWCYVFSSCADCKSGIVGEPGINAANLHKSMIAEGLTQPGVTGYTRET